MPSPTQALLRKLGIAAAAPSLALLRSLVAAFQRHVPYENASKLLKAECGFADIPSYEEFVDELLTHGFGSTCFGQAVYFSRLLSDLGFEVELLAVNSNGNPSSHAACRVRLGQTPFLVDLGLLSTFAGPFALDGQPIEGRWGDHQYFIHPKGSSYRLEIHRRGILHRTFENPRPTSPEALALAVSKTFDPDALFMRHLCVFKNFGTESRNIWNREFWVVSPRGSTKRDLRDLRELRAVLENELELPGLSAALGQSSALTRLDAFRA